MRSRSFRMERTENVFIVLSCIVTKTYVTKFYYYSECYWIGRSQKCVTPNTPSVAANAADVDTASVFLATSY